MKRQRRANSTPKLPHDVVEEILVRLPVKPLLRFCCVSKSWKQTISSHHFSKSQLLISKKMSTLQQKMLFKDAIFGKFKHFSLDSLLTDKTSGEIIELDCVYPFTEEITWVGSVNGLVCLALGFDRINVVLWNPCTRKFKKLPNFELDVTSDVCCVYGFGYDKSCDDYKVVRFEVNYKDVKNYVIMKIYSLRADCWKRIGNCEFRPETVMGSSAFVNGKIYWTLDRQRVYEQLVGLPYFRDAHIGYIDVETGERGVVRKPDYVKWSGNPTNLVESQGCLYFFYGLSYHGEVWKIECDGVGKDIWTKIAEISLDGGYIRRSIYRDRSWRNNYSRLLHVGMNGEIVLVSGQKLVIYNGNDCSFKNPDIGSLEKLMAGTFAESLTSPLI